MHRRKPEVPSSAVIIPDSFLDCALPFLAASNLKMNARMDISLDGWSTSLE